MGKGSVDREGKRKGEYVTQPVVNPKNMITRANKTGDTDKLVYYTKNAERIYKKSMQPSPNPLNISNKNLTKEAKEAWKYVYSMRKVLMDDVPNLHERVIYDGDEFLFLFEAYSAYIRDKGFAKEIERENGERVMIPIVPNIDTFARWLGVSNKLIRLRLAEMSDGEVKYYKDMLANLVSQGAMIQAYASQAAVFALRNQCDWSDKYDERHAGTSEEGALTQDEAEAILKKLGYVRPQLEDKNG